MSGLADLTARFTLVVFAIINIALIRIKSHEAAAPDDSAAAEPQSPHHTRRASVVLADARSVQQGLQAEADRLEEIAKKWNLERVLIGVAAAYDQLGILLHKPDGAAAAYLPAMAHVTMHA